MKFQLLIIAAIAAIGLSSCQGTFYEGGPGQVNVITKGAGFRSEGGGFVDTVHFIGTQEIANWWTKVNVSTIPSGPQMLVLDDLSVPIPALQNQSVVVDAGIMMMVNPKKIGLIQLKMPKWQSKIYTSFGEVTKKIIQAETKAFDASASEGAVLNRQMLGKKILEGTIREFKLNNPGFDDSFFFISVVIGDVVYPTHITDGYAKIAKKEYELQYEKNLKNTEVLREELEAQDMQSDLQAYATEGGVISKELLKYKNIDNVFEAMKDPNATIMIRINADGTMEFFK